MSKTCPNCGTTLTSEVKVFEGPATEPLLAMPPSLIDLIDGIIESRGY